jgi:DnaJ-class molecular chaperone
MTAESRATAAGLRSRILVLARSANLQPRNEARVRLHQKGIEVLMLEGLMEKNNEIEGLKLKRITCPACHGQRTQYSTKSGMRELCPACDGAGVIPNPHQANR